MSAAKKKQDLPDFDTDHWRTPDWLFDALAKRYGPFQLDAAADCWNAKAPAFYDVERNALVLPWVGEAAIDGVVRRVFCNPPYSQPNLPAFMAKARAEGAKPGAVVTMVIPLTRDAPWWHDSVFRGAGVIDNDRIRVGLDERGEERFAQVTRYDANGLFIEVIEVEGRIRFNRLLADESWGPTGSPAGGTAAITFISKAKG